MVKFGGKQLNMHNSPSRNISVVDRNLGLTQFETLMRHLLVVQRGAGGWKLERGNYNWNISNSEHGTMLSGQE